MTTASVLLNLGGFALTYGAGLLSAVAGEFEPRTRLRYRLYVVIAWVLGVAQIMTGLRLGAGPW
jgi:hypothetical protein